MESTADKELTLSSPGVLDKYQSAGKIAQTVLAEVIDKCVAGADIHELCVFGNKRIVEECGKVFFNKKMEKGIAFPVSISPNDICGHFSPLKEDSFPLADGDLVKIDLGVHIDGFPALLAHTIIVGTADPLKVKAASAAYTAVVAAAKMLAPGHKNSQISQALGEIATAFGVQHIEGVLSHELKQFVIDGNNVIIGKETVDQKAELYEFKVNDVFALDVIVSANETEGKTKESELRTTIFKRNIDANYDLKTKNGRQFMADVRTKFSDLCFSLGSFEDELVSL